MEQGDEANLSHLDMGAHSGTHIDAPVHFVKDGASVDDLDLSALMGPARVIAIRNAESIRTDELVPHGIQPGERVLFKTKNSEREWYREDFQEHFVHLSSEAAAYLAERKVRVVGSDYLSVGGFRKNERQIHRSLLSSGTWIIEGLYLAHVGPGTYDLICLPIKIADGDGAPARAILRKVP